MSGQRVPAGVVHPLPAGLREALIANAAHIEAGSAPGAVRAAVAAAGGR